MVELWLSTTLYVNNGVVGCHLSKVVKVLFAKLTTDFIDTRPSNKNSHEHLAIRFHQSCTPYMVL